MRKWLAATLILAALPAVTARTAEDTAPPAAVPDVRPPAAAAQSDVPLEMFRQPRLLGGPKPSLPQDEIDAGGEGWVQVNAMVGRDGRTFDVTVADSIGSKAMEQAAVKAMEQWTYDPASANGQAVDSAVSVKFVFRNGVPGKGAGREFLLDFQHFRKAFEAGDRERCEQIMAGMKATNLYENAYLGLAQYYHASKWGDPNQQLAALRRALAYESGDEYLPRPAFVAALHEKVRLETDLHLYGEAIYSARQLQQFLPDKQKKQQLSDFIAGMESLRTGSGSIVTAGKLNKSGAGWSLILLRNQFRIEAQSGEIQQLKLRCKRKYSISRIDPEVVYRLDGNTGECSLSVVGSAGATFAVHQL